jgi:peptide deformylase
VGDPVLHAPAAPIANVNHPAVVRARNELHAALADFRRRAGFGRAMAAPQVGHALRMVALHLGGGRAPFTMHNPELTDFSAETFTMWDDCLSFPDLLVRVRRHTRVGVTYADESGERVVWRAADVPTSVAELLQHEVDHLEGVTAFDRMVRDCDAGGGGHGRDPTAAGSASRQPKVIYRHEYQARKEYYDAMVDYCIVPTV